MKEAIYGETMVLAIRSTGAIRSKPARRWEYDATKIIVPDHEGVTNL